MAEYRLNRNFPGLIPEMPHNPGSLVEMSACCGRFENTGKEIQPSNSLTNENIIEDTVIAKSHIIV